MGGFTALRILRNFIIELLDQYSQFGQKPRPSREEKGND